MMKKFALEDYPQSYQNAALAAQRDTASMIADYKADPPATSKEKALVESILWLKVDPKYRKIILDEDGYEAKWLAYVLADGGVYSPFKVRSRALKELRNGFNVNAAWEALDNGARTEHVYESFSAASAASKKAPDGESHRAFEEALNEMLGKPPRERKRVEEEEQPKRRRFDPSRRSHIRPPAGSRLSTRGKAMASKSAEMNSESKILWSSFATMIEAEIPPYVTKRLEGLADASVIGEIINEFRLEVNACFQNMIRKVQNIRSKGTSKEILIVKQSQVIEASEVLGIKVPARSSKTYRNWRPDMALAKKAYFKLSARFHPDTNPDDPRCVERFHAIQNAWNTLKELE